MIRVICYGLFFAVWTAALTYDVLYIPSRDGAWFYKLKFLTIINMVSVENLCNVSRTGQGNECRSVRTGTVLHRYPENAKLQNVLLCIGTKCCILLLGSSNDLFRHLLAAGLRRLPRRVAESGSAQGAPRRAQLLQLHETARSLRLFIHEIGVSRWLRKLPIFPSIFYKIDTLVYGTL